MSETKPNMVIGWSRADCGCRWIPGMLEQCSKHTAAEDLFASLSEIVAEWGSPNTPKWHRAKSALDKATR